MFGVANLYYGSHLVYTAFELMLSESDIKNGFL